MTGYLSQPGATVDPFPMSCPKCGTPTRAETVARHLRSEHPGAIGTATLIADPSVAKEFAYIGPVFGASTQWWIAWLDLPIVLVRMRTAEWAVRWHEQGVTDAPEGER